MVHGGHVVTIRFRCLRDHSCKDAKCPKYLSLPDDPSRMYGVGDIVEAVDKIHVTEGEFDRLILKKALGVPTVALPGANAWRGRHRRLLEGFSTVYVWADPDKAGAEMAQRIGKALGTVTTVRLTVGDVSETYADGGRDALAAALEEAER